MAHRNPERLCLKPKGVRFASDSKAIAGLNNPSGYTIIEVLIAVAIFSIGILGMASLELSTARNIKTGNLVTQATMLARDTIETLKRVPDVTTLSNGAETDIDVQGNPGGLFDRSWTISNPLGGGNTRQITVTVSWNHNGENRSVELSTIAKN
jgi:prepilin-type N-terminal cleavage/methylation domain-containing protein